MATPTTRICDLRHPQYTVNAENWLKWRLTYQGGSQFLRFYLKKFSKREDDRDFENRKAVSYVPAFAKAALNDVKNSIFERISDVTRSGGPDSYLAAVNGQQGGVDLKGSTMNAFIGRELLPELLSMSRVGVYVDMPPLQGVTMADKGDARPYLYWYRAENICCWSDRSDSTKEFKAVLLMDNVHAYDASFNLPTSVVDRYRYVWIGDDGKVHVKFYNDTGVCCNEQNEVTDDDYQLDLELTKIPFVIFEISDSLLADIADYQIAHLNLASSDIAYALKSNHPFYTEQTDPRSQSPHLKQSPPNQGSTRQTVLDPSNVSIVNQEQVREIRVGVAAGRQYAVGTERPGFIHPSSEPLAISMQKQEQIKAEIRQLINLAISSLSPMQASEGSKIQDNKGLEAGLSYIGLELEHGERKIAELWAMYEGSKSSTTISYPETYQLLSDSDRRDQTEHYVKLLPVIGSLTAQKEVAKRIVAVSLGNKISAEQLKKINGEIDRAKVIVCDPDVIKLDLEAGLVGKELASRTRGYPEGEVEIANKEHAARLAEIAKSQTEGLGAARGVADAGANPKAGVEEKKASRDNTQEPVPTDKTRGEGK